MKAHEYAPVTPLESRPPGRYVSTAQRREALLDALRGVELGAYDRRILGWLLDSADDDTTRTLVSWLQRVRLADLEERVESPEESAAIVDANLARMGLTLGGDGQGYAGLRGPVVEQPAGGPAFPAGRYDGPAYIGERTDGAS